MLFAGHVPLGGRCNRRDTGWEDGLLRLLREGYCEENTEASILLQCDPYGSLEEAGCERL